VVEKSKDFIDGGVTITERIAEFVSFCSIQDYRFEKTFWLVSLCTPLI